MLFNSLQYLVFFLPVAWLGFRLLSAFQASSAQLLWLVACSVFFYASWDPVFVLLMTASVVVNFYCGRQLARRGGSALVLTTGVIFNLGLLAYFKYTGFFIENLNAIAGLLIPLPEITLPLAISFFTFQQIAYLVDVHRGEAREYSFLHYCLFVTFFPQLVAGPIVHHSEMMPQFETRQSRHDWLENTQVGITIIALGLFKKVVLADNLALLSDPLFARTEAGGALTFAEAWVAVGAFTGQIYFDFSGYTDIAIGSARLFGIRLPENFFSPYKSTSIVEFWRRWHITLSRFLRDYLYISLGGNRKGRVKRYRNLILTMVLGGLWHGAHWNFVIWGALHGFYLVINHFWRFLFPPRAERGAVTGSLLRVASWAITLLAVMIAWVFFRAQSTEAAFAILGAMANPQSLTIDSAYIGQLYALQPGFALLGQLFPVSSPQTIPLVFLSAALLLSFIAPNTQQFMARFQPTLIITRWTQPASRWQWRPTSAYALAIAVIAVIAMLGMDSNSEFIYFQF
jgi:D-alanyl-lipoteichoic acid acyltransferase DltB (MBOAT superfamily)